MQALRRLRLINFKCFSDLTVPFRENTIIVGKNNAGKSTIVEALRLTSAVANRFSHLRFQAPPKWAGLPLIDHGVAPSISDLEVNFKALFHQYQAPPALIVAEFINGSTIEVSLGLDKDEGAIHGVIRNSEGIPAKSYYQARQCEIPEIAIMPQVSPVSREETVLQDYYVRRSLSTPLASSHFRNQINLFPQYYEDFRKISQETWPGLRINDFIGFDSRPGAPLSLLVQNDDFVAEVAWVGHGLQMWLQTMWFIARSKSEQIVMLDEPDVYMHPDQQRRLIRFLRGRFSQLIVTTHSVAMLSEVTPDEVLTIDRRKSYAKFADSLPAMQLVVDQLGGGQSLQLSRLWEARKILLVVGKDMHILRHFYNLIFPDSLDSLGSVTNFEIGGWGGWNYAVGSAMLLTNATGEKVSTYCLLDSDYHTPEEIEHRFDDALSKNVRLHIWRRKEIESYLLIPSVIQRVIALLSSKAVTVEDVAHKMSEIATSMKDEVMDCFADSFLREDRGKGKKPANTRARELVNQDWDSGRALYRVPPKQVFSQLSDWSKKEYGASFSITKVVQHLRFSELPDEIIQVVSAIEANERFENSQ